MDQRRRCLGRLARHLERDDLFSASERELEAFVDRLEGTDGAAAEIYHVKGFFGWAHEYGLIDEDPSGRLLRPRTARRLPRPIPTEDLALALRLAPPRRVKPMLYLAAYAGLRAQDMCGLRGEDVRWDDRQLIVTDGKGGHEGVVDMCDTLQWALRSSELPLRGWLFPYADGRAGHIPAHRVSQVANRFLHSIGVSSTLHQCRHWAGTEFYQATRDLRATQQFLRHQSVVSTTIYTAVDRDITLAGVNRLPRLEAAS